MLVEYVHGSSKFLMYIVYTFILQYHSTKSYLFLEFFTFIIFFHVGLMIPSVVCSVPAGSCLGLNAITMLPRFKFRVNVLWCECEWIVSMIEVYPPLFLDLEFDFHSSLKFKYFQSW